MNCKFQESIIINTPRGNILVPTAKEYPPFDYENNKVYQLIKQLSPTGICLDIGAWVGDFTILMANTASKVIALEPDTTNYEYLLKNLEKNNINNVLAINMALAPKDGKTNLIVANSSAGHSIYAHGDKKYKVRTISLNSLILNYLWLEDNIELINMDIQRSEFYSLPNARNEVFYKVNKWIVETHGEGENKLAEEMKIQDLFLDKGYTVEWLELPAVKDNGRHIFAYR